MLAWGRRPWLGLRIKDLFFNAWRHSSRRSLQRPYAPYWSLAEAGDRVPLWPIRRTNAGGGFQGSL